MAMNMELEAARKRAIELGNTGKDHDELCSLLKSEYPAVRRAAASALGKMIDRSPSLAQLLAPSLSIALKGENSPQVLLYVLKTILKCAPYLNILALDDLGDIVRDPAWPDYVRAEANKVIAAVETAKKGLFCKIGHGHRDETRRICRLSAA